MGLVPHIITERGGYLVCLGTELLFPFLYSVWMPFFCMATVYLDVVPLPDVQSLLPKFTQLLNPGVGILVAFEVNPQMKIVLPVIGWL